MESNEDLFESIGKFLREKEENWQILTEEESEYLILSLAMSRGDEGFTDEEVRGVLEWATNVRVNESLLHLVLEGLTTIGWSEETNEPTFTATDLGRETAERGK